MPRLTPSQLADARRKKARALKAAREEVQHHMAKKAERLKELEALQPEWHLLKSVLDGLYDEVDKLFKKAPADEITELALKRINDFIKRAKQLLKGDPFVDSIDPFVPAGENPEHRDVLLILREIRQGMERRGEEYDQLKNKTHGW
jgi:DNA repair exonuclease SbcCD ATPase subunit